MGETFMTPRDEQRLIEQARQGDGESFGKIYDAYKRALFTTVIYPRVHDQDAAEEVLQDTFLLALKKIGAFRWEGKSIFFWLRIIAINKVREWQNTQRRTATVDDEALTYHHDNSFQPEDTTLLREEARELNIKISDILTTLNERYRLAIELRLKQRRSREECAADLGVSVETFDVIFFRACKSFKEKFIKKYGDLAGIAM